MAKIPKVPKIGDIACMSAGQINKALDRLEPVRSAINAEFIDTGRGHELPSETFKKTDPLALRSIQLFEVHSTLRREIERRYGPGAPSRLPSGRGFGPIAERCKK